MLSVSWESPFDIGVIGCHGWRVAEAAAAAVRFILEGLLDAEAGPNPLLPRELKSSISSLLLPASPAAPLLRLVLFTENSLPITESYSSKLPFKAWLG
jgi:hypothetical protein